MESSILVSPTLFSSLQKAWSNNNLWPCIFIRICHKNTILVAASIYSNYVTPLYYITTWYLHSIPSQIYYPKWPAVSLTAMTSLKLILANTISPNLPTIKQLKNQSIPNISFIIISSYGHNLLIEISMLCDNQNQWELTSTWASASMRTMAQPYKLVPHGGSVIS